MGHAHHHDHDTGNIKVAFFLNLSFTIIEIVGGLLTGSLAILSDALHDLGDSLSIGLSWYFQKLSKKERNNQYSYGYRRFSVLGALINAVILLVGSVYIMIEAIPRIADPQLVDEQWMLVLAIFGVVVNGAAVLRLRKGKSLNEKVISLHLLEDVLGWVAVLIGSIMIMWFDWYWIDPLLSVLIGLFIFYNVIRDLRSVVDIILQSTPSGIDVNEVEEELLAMSFIKEMHDCHIWSMDGEYHVFSAHLVLNDDYDLSQLSEIKASIKQKLKDLKIEHSTLEFEKEGEYCREDYFPKGQKSILH